MASWKFPGKNRQQKEGSLHPATQGWVLRVFPGLVSIWKYGDIGLSLEGASEAELMS